jgi:hypothetical protein
MYNTLLKNIKVRIIKYSILHNGVINEVRMIAKKRIGWVRKVQETSNAMDIPEGLFTRSSKDIAQGLKKAVLESGRTKGTKFQSAMSMLNFYINRAGKSLSDDDRYRLEQAKIELRKVFNKS